MTSEWLTVIRVVVEPRLLHCQHADLDEDAGVEQEEGEAEDEVGGEEVDAGFETQSLGSEGWQLLEFSTMTDSFDQLEQHQTVRKCLLGNNYITP